MAMISTGMYGTQMPAVTIALLKLLSHANINTRFSSLMSLAVLNIKRLLLFLKEDDRHLRPISLIQRELTLLYT